MASSDNPASTYWESRWQASNTRWDLGDVTPGVTQFLKEYPAPVGKNVLVPGCGSGYDVIAFAKHGYHAKGLDIAPTATQRATVLAKEAGVSDTATFTNGDFFTYSENVDLLFDYTFACAIDPSLRSAWAQQLSRIIVPGGHALILMFPLDNHKREGGPPFSWSLSEYCKYLEDDFELVFIKECSTVPARKGLERLSFWRRRDPKAEQHIFVPPQTKV